MNTLQFVRLEIKDFVAVITLDRPPVNATVMAMWDSLGMVFGELNERDDVRAIIFTGAGDKAFCAGRDIKAAETDPSYERMRRATQATAAILQCERPIVGAINGYALGAGFQMAACCDILIASERAVFGLPEIDVAVIGGYNFASRLLPPLAARKMFLTGERYGPQELYRLGMIDKVVPPDKLMAAAWDQARVLASKSPLAMRMAKRYILIADSLPFKDKPFVEQIFTSDLRDSEDGKELQRAFIEKRPPVFKPRSKG